MTSPKTGSYRSSDGGPAPQATRRRPFLVLAINGEHQGTPAIRIDISRESRVDLGRGEGTVSRRRVKGMRECRVAIRDSKLSASHAFVAQDEHQSFWLWDCGSKNGTALNGAPIHKPAQLRDGDWIGLGLSIVLFRSAHCLHEARGDVSVVESTLASLQPQLARTFSQASFYASNEMPVLVTGKEACGKRTVAKAIHKVSERDGRFVEVAAAELIEQILVLRDSQAGTLYLTDIESLSDEGAHALLRAITNADLDDSGSPRDRFEPRIIVAGRPGSERALSPHLRRLVGDQIVALPPLRDRREDLGSLVDRILREHASSPVRLRRSFSRALFAHDWPENIAELQAAIRHALASGETDLSARHLPSTVRVNEEHARERRKFIALVEEHSGNVSAIARALGVARQQVHRIAERLGVDLAAFRIARASDD